MRKSLSLLFAVAAIMSFALGKAWAGHFIDVLPPASASGCTPVSNGYDYNCTTDTNAPVIVSTSPIVVGPKSIAQINLLVPTQAGAQITCSNCVRSYVCISTGTGAGAWTVAVETGTMTGNPTHCQ